jgi:hypothetical protein
VGRFWHSALVLALTAGWVGCYQPSFSEGLSCSEDGRCPSGQVCSSGICVSSQQGSTFDAGADAGNIDAGPDANPCPSSVSGTETFDYTGAIEIFEIPDCVTTVTIEVFGAQGGGSANTTGGLGARMKGDFALSPGTILHVLVGQQGIDGINNTTQGGGTGGGGSFVVQDGTTPLLIAGGGGGGTEYLNPKDGGPGQIDMGGQAGDGSYAGTAGTDGDGGTACLTGGYHGGTGGAGFSGDGNGDSVATSNGTPNLAPKSFLNGGAGGVGGSLGRDGGFGGGGSSGFTGGGGGGYSGGGAGGYSTNTRGGGGGGSYNVGDNQDNAPGVRSGNGQVIISWQ